MYVGILLPLIHLAACSLCVCVSSFVKHWDLCGGLCMCFVNRVCDASLLVHTPVIPSLPLPFFLLFVVLWFACWGDMFASCSIVGMSSSLHPRYMFVLSLSFPHLPSPSLSAHSPLFVFSSLCLSHHRHLHMSHSTLTVPFLYACSFYVYDMCVCVTLFTTFHVSVRNRCHSIRT